MKGILYGITIFLGSLFALQGQEIRVQNENGDPLGFSHLRVLKEEGLLFVADQHGVFHLPGNMASGKVAISHIGYETFVLSYQAGESHKVTLKAKIYDLGDFEVNPMDEKVMVTNAFDVLKETMKTPSVTKAYYKALGFQKESGSEIYSADYFGVYLYKELVDRSKKQFEWFQNGLNGFVGEHNRQWHAESLEAPSKFDNFSQSYGFGAIIGMENYGYLNDLLFMVSDLKLKDLVVVEACSTGPYECYTYLTGDVELIIQIHALEQRIAHIEAKKLPRPRQPNIFWSSQKHMEVEFAWDQSDYFMSQVRWEDNMPNHKLKAELFFLEKNAAWDINWNKGKTSSFFDYTRSSYIPNYNSEKWKQMGLLSMLNQYSNENINVQKLKSIPSDPTSTEAGKSSREYWLQFYDYLHAQGIRWGGTSN